MTGLLISSYSLTGTNTFIDFTCTLLSVWFIWLYNINKITHKIKSEIKQTYRYLQIKQTHYCDIIHITSTYQK